MAYATFSNKLIQSKKGEYHHESSLIQSAGKEKKRKEKVQEGDFWRNLMGQEGDKYK